MKLAVPSLLLSATLLSAQDQTPILHATSELVLMDVQVLHTKSKAPAPALQASDFQVSEEGVSQEILQFSRDEFPLSVVLLFDLTDSVSGVLKRLAEGAETALRHFKGADEVGVMVYSGHASLVDGFTTDRARTLHAIEKAAAMTSDEPAYFNEAVYQAAVELRQAGSQSNRRVVIWLTDNLPNVPYQKEYPVHTEVESFRALHEEDVVVAPILLKSPLWAVLGPIVLASEASYKKSFPPGDARKYAELTRGAGSRPPRQAAGGAPRPVDRRTARAIYHRLPSVRSAALGDVLRDSGEAGSIPEPAAERVDRAGAAGVLPQVGTHGNVRAVALFSSCPSCAGWSSWDTSW
jgi:hypothetical protein